MFVAVCHSDICRSALGFLAAEHTETVLLSGGKRALTCRPDTNTTAALIQFQLVFLPLTRPHL